MYECQSYHLTIRFPDNLYVSEHIIQSRENGKKTLLPSDLIDEEQSGEAPPYIRRRRIYGVPYSHFYARNGAGLKRIAHSHVVSVEESPFATLRLAATLGIMCAIGILVAGVSVTGTYQTYDLRSTAIALVVSVPGIIASWSRQAFGIDILKHACLSTQFSLRATSTLSMLGLGLAVLQDAGHFRWPIQIAAGVLGDQHYLQISDWGWFGLVIVAWTTGVAIYCRYLQRRARYLALRRRSIFREDPTTGGRS